MDERSEVKLNKWAQLEGRMGPKKWMEIMAVTLSWSEGRQSNKDLERDSKRRPCIIMTFLSALQGRYHCCSLVDKDMGEVRKGQMTCPKS